jgi:peptidoglycan hydrolase-like protein with peptidoglycan-binding domain
MKKITEQQLIESARLLQEYNATLSEINPDIAGHSGYMNKIADLEKQGASDFAKRLTPMTSAEQERIYGPYPTRNTSDNGPSWKDAVAAAFDGGFELSKLGQPPVQIKDRDGTMQDYPAWLPLPTHALPDKETAASQPSSPIQNPASTTPKQSAKPSASRRDPAVEKLQKELRAKGYEIKVDGIMGPATKQALAYDQEFGADYAEKANKQISQANESLDRIMELTTHSFSDKVQNRAIAETTAAFRDFIDNIEEATKPGFMTPQPHVNPAATAPLPPGVGGVLDQATTVQPATTAPVKPTSQQFAMKPQSGYANIMNPNAQSTAKPTTPVQNAKPSSAVPADIYTNPTAIKAFQQANGLKVDGLIGPNTLQALVKQGVQPPAGFKPATAKQPAAKSVAKPVAKPVQNQMSASQADYDAAEAEFQKNNAAHDAEYNAKLAAIRAPRDQAAAAAAAPQQGIPSAALNTVGQSITPNFQSQQPVKEHVQFGELDSLARIISLARH